MEIIRRKLAKSIQEVKLRNSELLKENSFFMNSRKKHYINYESKFQKYLANSPIKQRLVWATLFRKMEWYIDSGQMLALDLNRHENEHLAQAAQYGYWWLTLGPQVTEQLRAPDDKNAEIQLRDATRAISYLLLTGHDKQAAEVSRICNQEINTQFITGGYKWIRHPWFFVGFSQSLAELTAGFNRLPSAGRYGDLSSCVG